MAIRHGIYISEVATQIQAPVQIDSGICVAIGTAKIAQDKPVICYTYKEFVENFGYVGDFDNYTLEEVAATFFKLYNVAPVICINALNGTKHFKEIEKEIEGQKTFKLEGEVILDTVAVTTGVNQGEIDLADDITTAEVTTGEGDEAITEKSVTISNASGKILLGGTVKISYRKTESALGGDPVVVEIAYANLNNGKYVLPEDAILESVQVTTNGINNLRSLDFDIQSGDSFAQVTILDETQIIDDKVKVTYHELDPSAVTAQDIIDNIEKVGGIYARFNIVPGTLIAPKFSLQNSVAAALTNKAKSIDGVFKGVAIADLDSARNTTYQAAIEFKNQSNLSDPHLIVCYPKVALDGVQYYLSTHLAALMNQVDSQNDGLPYVSPSNQRLQIDSAVTADGTEMILLQEQANLLNANGVGTVFSWGSWKYWGNYTSVGPGEDYKDEFIATRRMLNFLTAYLTITYFTNLDNPINRRNIEGILQSANIYLSSLAARGALLGARLEFPEDENTTANLMSGALHFRLYWLSPPPAQEIVFEMEVDTSYFETLFI